MEIENEVVKRVEPSSSSESQENKESGDKKDEEKDKKDKSDKKDDQKDKKDDASSDKSDDKDPGDAKGDKKPEALKEEDAEEKEKEQSKQAKGSGKKNKSFGEKMRDKAVKSSLNELGHQFLAFQFALLMKNLLLMMMNGLVAIVNGAIGLLAAIGQAILHVAAGIIHAAITLGTTGAIALGGVFCAVGVGVYILFGGTFEDEYAQARSDLLAKECVVDASSYQPPNDNMLDRDRLLLLNAQKTYAVFAELGFSNNKIAGILGNWVQESGIDNTCIEGISDVDSSIRYDITADAKIDAMEDFNLYVLSHLFDVIYADRNDISKDAYRASDNKYYPGLGVGQWTGGRAKVLMEFAESIGLNWWDMDTQLAFMLSPKDSGSSWLLNYWIEDSSPEVAAYEFYTRWERGPTGDAYSYNISERQRVAADYAEYMQDWPEDPTYANSIIQMSGVTIENASNNRARQVLNGCSKQAYYNNSSMAYAAVSYAWPTMAQSEYNDGTELYRRVHDNVYPGDVWYQSCDRGVACAVRWSGADNEYPAGATGEQLRYLLTDTAEWAEVAWGGNMELLLPGDIFIYYLTAEESGTGDSEGHTEMYVGNEIIKSVYPDSSDDLVMVGATFEHRSPGCRTFGEGLGTHPYRVFRNIQKEANPRYKNAALAGFDPNDPSNTGHGPGSENV